MRIVILSLLASALCWSSAFASSNCRGVQDSKGLRGTISTLDNTGALLLSYVDQNDKDHECTFRKDEKYNPHAKNAKKERYLIKRANPDACGAEIVWVNKSFNSIGQGYVDVEFACGGGGCAHGEPGPVESFYCDINK
jgi:hypothetical protein